MLGVWKKNVVHVRGEGHLLSERERSHLKRGLLHFFRGFMEGFIH